MKFSQYPSFILLLLGMFMSGCTSDISLSSAPQHLAAANSPQEKDHHDVDDPYETQNRAVLKNNMKFNQQIVYPIADSYSKTVPEPVREAVANFSQNLGEPAIFANLILQLRLEAAVKTAERFALNSTLGIGGLFDFATSQNITQQTGDFGQTLYVWGFRDSNYLVLPLLGPTNVRDAIGNGLQFAAMWPTAEIMPAKLASTVNNVNNLGTVLQPFSTITKAGDLQDLEKSSVDFYAMLRSVVEQKRKAELEEAIATSALTGSPKTSEPGSYYVPLTLYDVEKFYDPKIQYSTADIVKKPTTPENTPQPNTGSRIIIGEVTEGS